MGMEQATSSSPALSARRVVALAVAIGSHLALLVVLLRPATPASAPWVSTEGSAATLKLRFIPPSRVVPVPPPTPRLAASTPAVPAPAKMRSSAATHLRTPETASAPDTQPASPPSPAATGPSTSRSPTIGDGGFRDRVRSAQHAQDVHGVPGSDRTVAPGIALTDPMDQGIGAVVRKAQRLFGVTDPHCIDVDVWLNLSPDELIARHLTAADVDKVSQKYHCNRPPGLNF